MTAIAADRPILPLADQIVLAERRFCHALVQGCAREASRWLRLLELLRDRAQRLADRTPPPSPAPATARARRPESTESKNADQGVPPAPTAVPIVPSGAETTIRPRPPP